MIVTLDPEQVRLLEEAAGVHAPAGVGDGKSLGTPAYGSHERAPERRTLRPVANRELMRRPRGSPQADRFASQRTPSADGTPRPTHRHLPHGSRGRRVPAARSLDVSGGSASDPGAAPASAALAASVSETLDAV